MMRQDDIDDIEKSLETLDRETLKKMFNIYLLLNGLFIGYLVVSNIL